MTLGAERTDLTFWCLREGTDRSSWQAFDRTDLR